MNTDQAPTNAPHRLAFVRYRHDCTHSMYNGSKEGLIEAGLAAPECFARVGERDQSRRRLVRRWEYELADGGHARLTWDRENWFTVCIRVDADEQAIREAKARARGLDPRRACDTGQIPLAPIRAARSDATFQRFIASIRLHGDPAGGTP